MLSQFTAWFVGLVKAFFTGLWDFVSDAAIHLFTLLLTAVGSVIAAIPVPAWLTGGMNSLFAQLPSGVLYMLTQCGIAGALALLGSGYAFRLVRKVATLFQW